MVLGDNKLVENVYNCWIEKYTSKPSTWLLKGLEIVVQGADVYDEVRYVAFGSSPKELLVWAQVHGFDVAKDLKL